MFDFGGGTLDVAVVRRAGAGFEVLATGGLDDLGGVDLDAAIVRHLGDAVPAGQRGAWGTLLAPRDTDERRDARLLWDDVRTAKETLSRTNLAPVRLPRVGTEPHLTRHEFEALAAPLLDRAVAETRRVLSTAGLAPSALAGLYLVGGSSRVPLVSQALHSGLGVPPLVLEQPEVAVAEGAARLPAAAPPGPAAPAVPAAVPVPPGSAHPAAPAAASPLATTHPAAAPGSPRTGHPGRTASGRPTPARAPGTGRRRLWLLAIPAGILAVLAGAGVYVFGLHPGLSMLSMPSSMVGFAQKWWTSTSSCRSIESPNTTGYTHLTEPTNDTMVNAEIAGRGYVWRCDMTASVRAATTADYVVFTGVDSRSTADGTEAEHIQKTWAAEKRDFATVGGSYAYAAPSSHVDPHAKLYWTNDEYPSTGEDVIDGFLVSTKNGDVDKLYQLWRDHA